MARVTSLREHWTMSKLNEFSQIQISITSCQTEMYQQDLSDEE